MHTLSLEIQRVLDKREHLTYTYFGDEDKVDLLEVYWERNPHLRVTPTILKVAHNVNDLKFLLKRSGADSSIPTEVIATMVKNSRQASTMLHLLLKHDPACKVDTEAIM